MDVDTENRYAVLQSLGKTRRSSEHTTSPDNRKKNRSVKPSLAEPSRMQILLANQKPEPLPPGAPPAHPKYLPNGRRVDGTFTTANDDTEQPKDTSTAMQVKGAENNVTGGQRNNIGDSDSEL